jgi:hypothetical protein
VPVAEWRPEAVAEWRLEALADTVGVGQQRSDDELVRREGDRLR